MFFMNHGEILNHVVMTTLHTTYIDFYVRFLLLKIFNEQLVTHVLTSVNLRLKNAKIVKQTHVQMI